MTAPENADTPASVAPVSLVLTTLNEENSIDAFMEAIACQTIHPREIVVCDGGSTDATVPRLRNLTLAGTTITVFTVPGANIARGRNAAIARASGGIVAVTDAGCIPARDWLERITAPLRGDDRVTVVGGGYALSAVTRFERIVAAAEMRITDIPPDLFLPSSRSFAFRKSAWEEVGGYPEHLTFAGEDTDFCLKLRQARHTITLRLDAVVAWRPRPDLASYIRQHVLYGIGDGEAGNKRDFYLRILVKHGIFAALLVAGGLRPEFLALFCIVLLLYFMRMNRLYRWKEAPVTTAAAAFVLIGLKELSTTWGYVRGSWRRHIARTRP